VLNTERNADYFDEAYASCDDLADGQPDAGAQKLQDVSNHAQKIRSDVLSTTELVPADGLLSNRQECELPDDEARLVLSQ
jgi:hypothetical protein